MARSSGLPLGASVNDKRFKAALLDIGLLQNLCQVPVDLELREEDLLSMYRGKQAEQFVAQELMASHSSSPELFYWARKAQEGMATKSTKGELLDIPLPDLRMVCRWQDTGDEGKVRGSSPEGATDSVLRIIQARCLLWL